MSTPEAETCHDRFRSERVRLGFSHAEAGALCGASRRTVIDWESKTAPGADRLERLARFGFDVLYICTGRRDAAAQSAGQEPALSPSEWRLLKRIRGLSRMQQKQAEQVIDILALGGSPTGGNVVSASGTGTQAAGNAIYNDGRPRRGKK